MKLSLEQIYRAYPVFQVLIEQPLTITVNLKLREVVRELQPHFQEIADIQNAIVREQNYPQDESGSYLVTEQSHDEFLSILNARLQRFVDINWEPITVDEIVDAKLSIKELEAVSFLFSDIESLVETPM